MTILRDEMQVLRALCDALAPVRDAATGTAGRQELLHSVQKECERLKKKWTVALYSSVKDYALKRYIHHQQEQLLDLCDSVNGWLSDLSVPLLHLLLELNDFLFLTLPAFYNLHSKLPDARLAETMARLTVIAEQLDKAVLSSAMDQGLQACLADYCAAVRQGDSLTYRRRDYFVQLAEAVMALVARSEKQEDITEKLSEALFYLNFNDYRFCNWRMKAVRRKKHQMTAKDWLAMLIEERLLVSSVPVTLVTACEPDTPPVNLILEHWLTELIRQEEGANPGASGEESKMAVTLSVTHFSLLVRLLYEEGFFAVNNVAEIMRFFARYFSSKRQFDLSPKSMRKAFYTKDPFTAAVVKDLLSRMLQRLNNLFFRH